MPMACVVSYHTSGVKDYPINILKSVLNRDYHFEYDVRINLTHKESHNGVSFQSLLRTLLI